ncbi:MAG: glycerophosphodiester phosphodiesterase [Nitrospiraceae bacterium]|nr:MAG: glycerophosphodiester phosphodiesterase [Nitrospiraceae bacterium]
MFLRVGHRGARAYELENTVESFKKAIDLGANAIELDLRRSKDGIIIVCHDDNLKRLFGKEILVHKATLDELKQSTENRIATLEEVLRFIDRKVDKILVELKETGYEKKILDMIRKERLENNVIIVSFLAECLTQVRSLNKDIETGLIYTKLRNPVEAAQKLGAQYLVPLYRFIHKKDVEKAHKYNLKVIVWTINTKEEAIKYIAKGVDGIASDKPDIFKDII